MRRCSQRVCAVVGSQTVVPDLKDISSHLRHIWQESVDSIGAHNHLLCSCMYVITVRSQLKCLSLLLSFVNCSQASKRIIMARGLQLNRRKKKAESLLSHRPSSAADGQQSYRMPPSVRDNLLRPQSVGPPSSRPAPVIQSTRSAGFTQARSSARGQAAVAFGAFGAVSYIPLRHTALFRILSQSSVALSVDCNLILVRDSL